MTASPPKAPLSPFDRYSPGVARPPVVAGPEKSKRWRRRGYAATALLAVSAAAAIGILLYVAGDPAAPAARAAANAQLEDIKAGRWDAAYARLSGAWRAQLERDEFEALLRAHPAITHNAHYSLRRGDTRGERTRFEAALVSEAGEREQLTLELVRERDRWVVAAMRFGGRR
jgi:hypothetical protein